MLRENTSLIGVFKGSWQDLFNQFIKNTQSYNAKKVERLAKLYIKYGELFKIRADLAWAQMEHETGFLSYKGIAKPEWNNFAGIGVTGAPGAGNRFKTEELGVIAHYAHLAWYVYPQHVNQYCSKKYDPRHFGIKHNYNGDHTLKRLNDAWAVPGKTYAQSIAKLANQVFVSDSPITLVESITQKVKNALTIETNYDWGYIAIHHSVSDQFKTTMDKIKRWHLARGFIREGYNFGINGYGEIEVGRPLMMAGAHVKGWNTKAVGICLYGDFRYDILTKEQEKAAYELCKNLMSRFGIAISNVKGHKEFPDQKTACPCIDMNQFREKLISFLKER